MMKAKMKTERPFAILVIFLFVFLSSCGMQGDLYLPGSEDPNTSVKLEKSK